MRAKVLHQGFRAQSVIKILVIALTSAFWTEGLVCSNAAVSTSWDPLLKQSVWNGSLDRVYLSFRTY